MRYGRAIATLLPALEHCASFDDLLAAYEDPPTALADAICAELPEGDILVRALVVDGAFWWRLRELVGKAARVAAE